jgi:hypothetical protein
MWEGRARSRERRYRDWSAEEVTEVPKRVRRTCAKAHLGTVTEAGALDVHEQHG